MAKAIIYTTPTCQYCKMAKAFFRERGVEYEEKDVSIDEAALAVMVKKSGQYGVPVIELGDSIVIGFDQGALEHILEEEK